MTLSYALQILFEILSSPLDAIAETASDLIVGYDSNPILHQTVPEFGKPTRVPSTLSVVKNQKWIQILIWNPATNSQMNICSGGWDKLGRLLQQRRERGITVVASRPSSTIASSIPFHLVFYHHHCSLRVRYDCWGVVGHRYQSMPKICILALFCSLSRFHLIVLRIWWSIDVVFLILFLPTLSWMQRSWATGSSPNRR